MSEEGLTKLTEYLKQTRRQAEMAIDVLNGKVTELSTENQKLKKYIEEIEKEREYLRNIAEKCKNESLKKWKFQERDEWKAMLDNVQRDRSKWQEECVRLEICLEEAKEQNSRLEDEAIYLIQALRKYRSPTKEETGHDTDDAKQIESIGCGGSAESRSTDTDTSRNDYMEKTGENAIAGGSLKIPHSPRGVEKRLKLELDQAREQIEMERNIAYTDKMCAENEICRLKQELLLLRKACNVPVETIEFQQQAHESIPVPSEGDRIDNAAGSTSPFRSSNTSVGWFALFGRWAISTTTNTVSSRPSVPILHL